MVTALSLLSACENVEMPQESEVSEGKNEEKQQVDQLPEMQEYAGQDFVLAVAREKVNMFSTDEESESIVRAAVETRNRLVTDKYGIILEVKSVRENTVAEGIKNAAAAGMQYADLLCFSGETLVELADRNLLYNLLSSNYFDINAKYIDTDAAKSITANNALYMIYGSATQYYDNAWVIFYDKKLISDVSLEDPAMLAASGMWTWEKFVEYSEKVAYRVMSKGSPDLKADIFGFASYNSNTELPLVMWESCGIPMFGQTYRQPVTINADLTAVTDTIAQIKEIYSSKSRYTPPKNEAIEAFNEGRLAFFIYRLEFASTLAGSKREWGLLPLPKLTDEQERYNSYVDANAPAMAIPFNVSDSQRSVLLLNAFLAASGEAVRDAVRDKYVNLFFQNNESTVMLDTIMDSAYFDVAALYGSGMSKIAAITSDVIINAVTKNGVVTKTITDQLASFNAFSEEKFP